MADKGHPKNQIFFILFAFIVIMRFISYRETLALAEKGRCTPSRGKTTTHAHLGHLDDGDWYCAAHRIVPLGFGPWMIFALIPLFFGLGLLLIYVLTSDHKKKAEAAPPTTE